MQTILWLQKITSLSRLKPTLQWRSPATWFRSPGSFLWVSVSRLEYCNNVFRSSVSQSVKSAGKKKPKQVGSMQDNRKTYNSEELMTFFTYSRNISENMTNDQVSDFLIMYRSQSFNQVSNVTVSTTPSPYFALSKTWEFKPIWRCKFTPHQPNQKKWSDFSLSRCLKSRSGTLADKVQPHC